jgi:hypothetical protein
VEMLQGKLGQDHLRNSLIINGNLLFHGEPEDSRSRGAGTRTKIDNGSLTYDGATAELKFAAASATGRTRCGEFVDQKDERKPIVLVISDQKLPVEKWVSESDMIAGKKEAKLDAAFPAALK